MLNIIHNGVIDDIHMTFTSNDRSTNKRRSYLIENIHALRPNKTCC